MSFDPKCRELAVHFLGNGAAEQFPHLRDALAQHIQDEIETWIEYQRDSIAADLRRKPQ